MEDDPMEILEDTNQDRTMESQNPIRTNTVASLPGDIMTYIFTFLDTKSKGRAAQVSQTWNDIINHGYLWKDTEVTLKSKYCNPSTRRSINVRKINRFHLLDVNPNVCEFFQISVNVEHLRLEDCCPNDYVIDCFRSMSELKSLNLTDCSTAGSMLQFIVQRFPNLEELIFSKYMSISDHVLHVLSGLKNLRILQTHDFPCFPLRKVSDIGISYLTGSNSNDAKGMVYLEHLRLGQMRCLTNDALKDISLHLTNLVSLDLRYCISFSDSGVENLHQLKKLELLRLAHCFKITDVGLKYVTRISSLKSLDVSACFKITDSGLEFISQLSKIKCLNLSHCTRITDTGLENLMKLSSLQKLDCRHCIISNTNLVHLAPRGLKLIM